MNKMTENEQLPVLLADNLCFSYQQKNAEPLSILQGVSLAVQAGETVAIVGASGSGKSTLLHLLAGLDMPSSGEVQLCGHALSRAKDSQRTQLRSQYMGFVYQFHHLLPEFSALENVALPLKIRGESAEKANARAEVVLAQVGLSERMLHRPAELSGGERQRAAIARALVSRPRCLLADEPTGNLDQHNAQSAFTLMQELVAEVGGAMIMVTHDRALARRMQRCYDLRHGQLVLID